MCIISRLYDWGNELSPDNWDPSSLKDFKDLIEKAKELDTKLGQPDCEDPSKADWMKQMEERFKEADGA